MRPPRPVKSTPTAHGSPIRVLLVISNLEYGGAQRQVVELVNAAHPSVADFHICSLSHYIPLAASLKEAGTRLHVIHKYFKYDVSVVPRLAWLLRRLSADVVHSYLFDADIATRLAGRLARTPLIVGSERNTDYSLKPIQLRTYAITHRMVDLIIANSNAGAQFNSRTLGHPASMYRVVHNGVDTTRFAVRTDVRAIRRELGLAPTDRVVGMFASFKEQKNHPLFFAAAKRVLQTAPATKFMIVGDQLFAGMHGSDTYKQRIKALVDRLGVGPSCLFLGNRNDVPRLYAACDLTVLPSLFEGTPNVALESMACGVPVIATDVSDNASIIPHERTGLIVALGDETALADAMLSLLRDDARRSALGCEARKWVQQEFSTQRLAERTISIFVEALAERAG